MSTHLWNEILHKRHVPCGKRFVVQMERETLADYVKRVREEKGFSLAEVSKRSGGQIANSHISRIENGFATNVTPQKLRALAKGLDVPEDEIFAVARGKAQEEPSTLEQEVGVLFYGWADASEEDRAATLEMIKMIAESFQQRRGRKKKK